LPAPGPGFAARDDVALAGADATFAVRGVAVAALAAIDDPAVVAVVAGAAGAAGAAAKTMPAPARALQPRTAQAAAVRVRPGRRERACGFKRETPGAEGGEGR
jgi:hypothetical protein